MTATTKAARYLFGAAGATTAGLGGTAYYRYRQVQQREAQLPTNSLDNVFPNPTASKKKNTSGSQQRVLVIGGGVVGVTTAYKLALKGRSVAVLEPASHAAAECSACAAGGMQVSNPTVDRDSWMAVLKCLAPPFLFEQQPFRCFHISWFKTLSDPFFLRWVLTFTKTSLFPDQNQQWKQREMLDFTKYAVGDMVHMMENSRDCMAKKSGYNPTGCLSVSYEEPTAAVATTNSNDKKPAAAEGKNPTSSKRSYEPSRPLVGRDDVVQQEPSLQWQEKQPTAANYEYEAKSASSERFTKELARRGASERNVTFLYDTRVEAISVTQPDKATAVDGTTTGTQKPKISAIHTNRGIIHVPADVKVVVAAGSWTPHVLALMDLYAPVYPLKGYAMSVSAIEAMKANKQLQPRDLPSRIVCDEYMFTSRLGDEIRITSIGEFSGWSTKPTPQVDIEFRRQAAVQFPQLRDLIQQAPTRCGHRPFVSDGVLLLGGLDTHDNVYVSCGPGSNGWKLAMGLGEIIERLVSGQTAEQIGREVGFNVSPFSPAGRVLHAPFFAKLCRARWYV